MTLDLRQSLSVTRVLLTWHQYPHLFIFVTSISTYICWDMILDLSQSPSVTRVLLLLIHTTLICPYLWSACDLEYFQWHQYPYLFSICWDMVLDLSQSPSVTRVLLLLIHLHFHRPRVSRFKMPMEKLSCLPLIYKGEKQCQNNKSV